MRNQNNSHRRRRIAIGLAVIAIFCVFALALLAYGVLSLLGGGRPFSLFNPTPTTFVPVVSTIAPAKPAAPAPAAPPAVGQSGSQPVTPSAPQTAPRQPHPDGKLTNINDFVCQNPRKAPEKFGYGIQSNWATGDIGMWNNIMADKLKVNWTKAQVRWKDYEPEKGKINDYQFRLLDAFVGDANKKGLNILIGVIDAPAWTRKQNEPGLIGPPDDYAEAERFFKKVTARYSGCIQAIEVWNEMNLDREWRVPSGKIDPIEYVNYLKRVVPVIRSADPNVLVVMGALSPTGSSNPGKWMDDFEYMDGFVKANGHTLVDCVGVHLNGFNMPPDKRWDEKYNDPTAKFRGPFDNPNHSWSFISTMEGYRQKTGKSLCVTEFGWPTIENLNVSKPPPGFEFAADNSEKEQAEWIVKGFEIMKASGYVRFGIVFNLDYIAKVGESADKSDVAVYSVIYKDGKPRPAFDAIERIKKD
jgi:hypothetical protein